MIYLKIAHTNDNDADYFKFVSLSDATKYIYFNQESEWIMSDIIFEEMPESDYTFIDYILKEIK